MVKKVGGTLVDGICETKSCGVKTSEICMGSMAYGYNAHCFLYWPKLLGSSAEQVTWNHVCSCRWGTLLAPALLPCP